MLSEDEAGFLLEILCGTESLGHASIRRSDISDADEGKENGKDKMIEEPKSKAIKNKQNSEFIADSVA